MIDDLKETKKLLIVVDMVNGFVNEGPMSDRHIRHIINPQLELIETIRREGHKIAFIKDNHEKGCREFERYPEHCVIGTHEAEIIDEFKPYLDGSLIYSKNSTSTVFAPHFLSDLEQMKNLREVIISGCCTDICIANLAIPLQNYFDQSDNRVDIIIPVDSVETYNSPDHNRDEYNQMAYKFFEQSGTQLVKRYGGNKYGK